MQVDGTPAKANDSSTWNTYEACTKAKGFSGIGFQITDPTVGIDLDFKGYPGAKAFDYGTVPKYAADLVRESASYTEWSPSGFGLHIIARRPANSPALTIKNHEAGVEVYTGGRYFTYTGHQVPGTGEEITYYNAAIYSPYGRAPAPAGPSGLGLHIGTGASGPILKGSRNDTLFRRASALRGMGLDEPAILAALEALNRTHCDPPMQDMELQRLAHSVMRYEAGSPTEGGGTGGAEEKLPVPELTFWETDELLEATMAERKMLVGIKGGAAVFTTHSLNQVFAFRGTGKTLFQFALAASMAGGRDFLCYSIPQALRVLYIEGELPDAQIQERFKSLGVPKAAGKNLVIVSRDRQLARGTDIPSLHTERGRKAIEAVIDRFNPDVLFLDSMSSLLQLGTNDEESWLELLQWFTRLRCRGVCVIMTQQTGKDQSRGSRGHSRSEDPLDVSIQLTKQEEESEFLHCKLEYTKFRAAGRGVKSLVIRKEEGKDWAWATSMDHIKDQIREILKKDAKATNTTIVELVGGRKQTVIKLIQEVKEETAAF